MPFIEDVLECTKEYEAPRRFYYWASLAAVSAVLKDKVYFDMGKAYKLYPNIYVLLYGPSGIRKGPPIALAEQVVTRVDNTRVINGRSSIEAIFKELGTIQSREKKEPLRDSCGFVIASELSSSIISNPSAMDIMTHLYDRIYNEGEWKYRLKVGESFKLNKPTITWLCGTNEALFKDFIPEKNIHGGLIGRMFMISENKPNTINSLMFDPQVYPDYDKLAETLRPVSMLSGQFEMESSLRGEVNKWYINFKREVEPRLMDETGFVSRIEDFILKVAMIISSGRRADKIITKADWDESVEVTLPLILPTRKLTQAMRRTDPSEVRKRGLIVSYIANSPDFTTTRKEILKNLSLEINHEDLDKAVELLLQADSILASHNGSTMVYKLNMNKPEVKAWIERDFMK